MDYLIRGHRDRASFVRALHLYYSPRLHAAVLLTSAVLLGWLTSKALLALGLTAPWARFPLAVLIAYLLFLVLVEIWLVFLGLKRHDGDGNFDGPYGGESKDSTAPFEGAGGEFDGGGASADFDTADEVAVASGRVAHAATRVGGEGKIQASTHAGDFAGHAAEAATGLAEFFPLAVLVFVLGLLAAAVGWIVTSTPIFMVEVALEAAIAAGLIRGVARRRDALWYPALFERSVGKAVLLLVLAFLLGIAVRWIDPGADTVGQAIAHLLEK